MTIKLADGTQLLHESLVPTHGQLRLSVTYQPAGAKLIVHDNIRKTNVEIDVPTGCKACEGCGSTGAQLMLPLSELK